MKEPAQLDPKLLKVLRTRRKGGGKHSALYLWMRANHGPLRSEFRQHGPQWETRLAAMIEIGLTDGRGKPPTLRTAQQTWYRVVTDVNLRSRPSKAEPEQAEQPERSMQPARYAPALYDPDSVAENEAPPPRPKIVLTPARPYVHSTEDS